MARAIPFNPTSSRETPPIQPLHAQPAQAKHLLASESPAAPCVPYWLMSREEVSRITEYSKNSLDRLKELRPVRLGKLVRYRSDEVFAFLNSLPRVPAQETA